MSRSDQRLQGRKRISPPPALLEQIGCSSGLTFHLTFMDNRKKKDNSSKPDLAWPDKGMPGRYAGWAKKAYQGNRLSLGSAK
ncbi:hypothetical protein QYF36_000034 [Acer negundo]|nr:hypothetical protein QYF36_000034 [Acer negundo]